MLSTCSTTEVHLLYPQKCLWLEKGEELISAVCGEKEQLVGTLGEHAGTGVHEESTEVFYFIVYIFPFMYIYNENILLCNTLFTCVHRQEFMNKLELTLERCRLHCYFYNYSFIWFICGVRKPCRLILCQLDTDWKEGMEPPLGRWSWCL